MSNRRDDEMSDESETGDVLDDSPVLEAVLGKALPALRMFHVKLVDEGLIRGMIGPRDANIIWERHILNSAAAVPLIRKATAATGHRRVEWLEECISLMKLDNVTVVRERAEEAIASCQSHASALFNVVTCRAVAPMRKLAGWTLPLLVPGGCLIAIKGRSASVELEKANQQIRKSRGVNARVLVAPVGPDLEPTHAIVIEKERR